MKMRSLMLLNQIAKDRIVSLPNSAALRFLCLREITLGVVAIER
jgi:hypothetical protein